MLREQFPIDERRFKLLPRLNRLGKMMAKKTLVVFAALFFLFAGALYFYKSGQKQLESRALGYQSLAEIEREYGEPFYVFEDYPPTLGKGIVSAKEFKEGIIIKAYSIQNMPPKFLVVKLKKSTGEVLQKIIQGS